MVEEAFETEETTELDEESMVTFALCARSEQTNIMVVWFAMNSRFHNETVNYGINDTGCTNNVCGAVWLDFFIKGLPDGKIVETWASETRIMFENMGRQNAVFRAKIPCFIARSEVYR